MFLTSCLHTAWFCVSFPDSPFSLKFSFTLSCVHPPQLQSSFLYPPLHSHHHHSFATYFSSILMTCPYNFNFCHHFLGYLSRFHCTCNSFIFNIPFIVATPHIHLNILLSAMSNFFSCTFFAAHEITSELKACRIDSHRFRVQPFQFVRTVHTRSINPDCLRRPELKKLITPVSHSSYLSSLGTEFGKTELNTLISIP